ncbi:P-loop containing nucleoside triphosphate hydrolase protein [Cylindrobasidium torrendii FP15055 ss-10]|uniref:p-loop containing nucleoside triphosphate hydrolase protein n=1 Tax=Cylindrobasidium torrendii FP15055 ss-10 TaxID=1314674 RepID=A0A0D7BRV6_9AGAR|nr:P-loop containing nucleoside triphosphate hydrolase protein [Cylindrobasidium torrendii FP15055 ss-10]
MNLPFLRRLYMRHRSLLACFGYLEDLGVATHSDAEKVPILAPMHDEIYDIWAASRTLPNSNGGQTTLVAGARRPVTVHNIQLAWRILQRCTPELFQCLFETYPARTTVMLAFNVLRSLFPAFRGYSQAMILDEIQVLISSGVFTWSRLGRLVGQEVLRRVCESMLDHIAVSNETLVLGSARFHVERQQLEQRVRLDGPSLADPATRDLLQESDIFARSFGGGGFGLISPLDFIQLLALLAEIGSHILVLHSLTHNATHLGLLVLSIISVLFPLILPWFSFGPAYSDMMYTPQESYADRRREQMRNLAYADVHRPEVSLFGLKNWILSTWETSWKVSFASESTRASSGFSSLYGNGFADVMLSLQNIPFILVLQSSSSATLGSLTLYRSSVQAVVLSARSFISVGSSAFQVIFLLGAFSASKKIHPKLQPRDDEVVDIKRIPAGMKIEARGISYTYPDSSIPALHNVNFSLMAGETLAIVGYNGSGKSTLAKILLRVLDFDGGQLLVNGTDIRKYSVPDFHSRVSAVFQGFSKYNNYTLQENVGLGAVDLMGNQAAVKRALHLAEADGIVKKLPHGLQTMLEGPGFEMLNYPGSMASADSSHHGLSGGEWQRVAIARSFIKAVQPQVDLLVFDEPTSSLDAQAQSQIFNTIERISCSEHGERIKSVIFITHRLSTARRADKIAMMDRGTICEFGSHEELLRKGGKYATLYQQSV